ncbi:phage holin family protein [Prosthecobacter fluviatilis]|uniref:Phage holin family protein n=1 Tax=Prosthecobacter fluviatilis TaxID=445931 RepID=A0ABW0KR50_9BACT
MNPGTPPAPEERASATGLLRALALYIEARGRLLHIEGQEAGSRLSNLTGMFMLALTAFVIGWMLATPALVWIIAESNGWHWTHVALAGAGIHLFLGLLLLAGLKARLRGMQLFEESFNQFRRDREWLASNKNN